MTIIECKNCGAKVALAYNQTFATCEYCGSIVTPPKEEPELSGTAGNINSLLKRIHLFLEDGKWDSAKEYCEKVLDMDAECAQAYLYRLMAICNIDKPQKLITRSREISEMDDYQKALRFATPEFRKMLEELSLNNLYYLAKTIMDTAQTEAQYKKAAVKFKKISTWKDSEKQREKCLELAEVTGIDTAFNEASTLMSEADFKKSYINESDRIVKLEKAIELFATIPEWKNADSLKDECERMLTLSTEKEKQDKLDKLEQEKINELQKLTVAKRKKTIAISALILIGIFITAALITQIIIPSFK